MQNIIKWKYFVILYITFIISEALTFNEVDNIGSCAADRIEENRCGAYAYKVMKPLLDYVHKMQSNLENHDEKIKIKDREIGDLKIKLAQIVSENEQKDKSIDLYKQLNDSQTAQIDFVKKNNRHLTKKCQSAKLESDQVAVLNLTITAFSETIKNQNSQLIDQLANKIDLFIKQDEIKTYQQNQLQNILTILNETQVRLEKSIFHNLEGKVDSCVPYANSLGIHKIKVPGVPPFNVLCGSAAAEPGWIVIQQRINGKEDFYRDFATYQAGFGSLNEDFFLGLEKIYRLTANQPHELYVHMENLDEEIYYAKYDYFAIAGEDDQYKMLSLDGFSGYTVYSYNSMGFCVGQKFHTFDKDNSDKCAEKLHGGWWYHFQCGDTNLNGKYYDQWVTNKTSIHWYETEKQLTKVQMLIRPTFD